jgi:integrase
MGTIRKRKTAELRDEKGKIVKHSRTRYRAEIFLQGHPRVSKTFWNRKIADKWIRDTEDAMRAGIYAQNKIAQNYTVKTMIDRYVEEDLPKLRSADSVRKQLYWWREKYGVFSLASFTSIQVLEGRDELSKANKGPATVNRYLASLSSCLTHAVKHWQWIKENPCSNVPKLKEPAGRTRFLDDDERKRLLDACSSVSSSLHLAVVLALSTGARRMNVWSLRWSDIDLSEGKETIVFLDTKNRSDVHLPLSGPVITLLLAHRKARRLDSNLLFPSKIDVQKPFDFKAPFARALKQAKIDGFRWHDLRHSAASYLAQQGVDLRRIAAILGHKTLQMSMRYSHLNVESLREDLEKMTRKLA